MRYLVTLCIISFFSFLQGQESNIPKVFTLGESEQAYESLNQAYSKTLLEATNGDIKTAFDQWLNMMKEMDRYAEDINYDLNGAKIWLHVFWAANGKIDHIGYLLRSDSKNINEDELKAFFSSFMNRYTFPIKADKPFNHYTGATFPTFSVKVTN
ncbi:MAG: hypothetical protein R2828_22600 [Saprospiraceae bacterium]